MDAHYGRASAILCDGRRATRLPVDPVMALIIGTYDVVTEPVVTRAGL